MRYVTSRLSEDKLSCQEWIFDFTSSYSNRDFGFYLNEYYEYIRETTRHKFKEVINRYSRLATRGNSLQYSQVPLPNEIVEEAAQFYRSQVLLIDFTNKQSEKNSL